VATGCCTVDQAEKSIDLSVILTIAASFALGAALEKTGVASVLASNLIDLSGGTPWLMLALVYAAVSLLTEAITNNSAAILVLPIALGIAKQAGLNDVPFAFAVMMAASASFATPIGYQTNLMVQGPGGYRFSDFVRVGVPMNLFVGLVTVVLILFIWPLK
jgi:di/tricarboxylate transporter